MESIRKHIYRSSKPIHQLVRDAKTDSS